MALADPQIPLQQILQLFHQDQLYLFLAAAITTIGLLAAAFCLLRRRLDPLLFWFSLFALLYGIRLWMRHQLLALPGQDGPTSERIRSLITFLIPIPAFFFVARLNLLSRTARLVVWIITPFCLLLALGTVFFGPRLTFDQLNDFIVTIALIVLIVGLARSQIRSPENTLTRTGLFVFGVSALYENVGSSFGPTYNVELFGFVILLACLGIVAGRHTRAREHQLNVIQGELEIAQRIQRSILPPDFPPSTHFRVAARYLPMTAVAGDFYDFLLADDHHAGLLLADVSGHGIPAALIASMVKLAANSQRSNATRPADLLLGMNSALLGNTQGQFVTAAYVYLNAHTRELLYAAAAHPPMLLLRQGQVTSIVENGLLLAAFPFATYTTLRLPLEPGDRLLLYTDGLLEAENATAEEFGADRLSNLLQQTSHHSPNLAADHILSATHAWSPTQTDDLTLLLCDFHAEHRPPYGEAPAHVTK